MAISHFETSHTLLKWRITWQNRVSEVNFKVCLGQMGISNVLSLPAAKMAICFPADSTVGLMREYSASVLRSQTLNVRLVSC